MYVLYLKHIKYWKRPAIFKEIVPCFMYPAFIELYSSANNFLFLLYFALAPHSTITLVYDFTYLCLCSIPLPISFPQSVRKTYTKMLYWTLFSFPVQLLRCFMLLQPTPSTIIDLCWAIEIVRQNTIDSNHILFVDFEKNESKTCKTVNRILIHKFWSLCVSDLPTYSSSALRTYTDTTR